MQIGKININPQPNQTFTVSICGYQVIRVPKDAAAEFIGMCRSMGFVSETDAGYAIDFLTKPAEQDVEDLVHTGLVAVIASLNMVHDGIEPDDPDELAAYDNRYETAANILEALAKHITSIAEMLRVMHEKERDDVEKDEPKPVCMCKKGDPYCGTPGCDGLIGKKKSSGFSLHG